MSFSNDPVMPGCLGLELRGVGFYLGWTGNQEKKVLGVAIVKFTGEVLKN